MEARVGRIDRIVGSNVRSVRTLRDLTTDEIEIRCAELGVPMSRRILQAIERGDRQARIGEVLALAHTLGVHPTKLLYPDIEDESAVAFGDAGATMSNDEFAWWLSMPDEPVPAASDPRRESKVPSQRHLMRRAMTIRGWLEADALTDIRAVEQLNLESHAVMTSDLDFRITAMNRAAVEMFGYPIHEALGMPLITLFTDRHVWAERMPDLASNANEEGTFFRVPPTKRINRMGEQFWVETVIAGLFEDGELAGHIAAVRKVPDPEFVPQADLPDTHAEILLSPTAELISWPRSAQRLLGWSADEVIGCPYSLVMSGGAGERTRHEMTDTLVAKGIAEFDSTFRRKDDTEVRVHVSAVSDRNAFGEIIQVRIRFWPSG